MFKVEAEKCAPLTVRQGAIDDLDALARLEQAAFAVDGFHRRQLRYLLTRAHASVYVAIEDGDIKGSAIMLWRRRSRIGRLYSIAAHPSAQGRGVGRALLQTCEAEALLRGCRRLSLEVRASNTPAITFYERHGYRVMEELPGFYEDGANAIRMCKNLS